MYDPKLGGGLVISAPLQSLRPVLGRRWHRPSYCPVLCRGPYIVAEYNLLFKEVITEWMIVKLFIWIIFDQMLTMGRCGKVWMPSWRDGEAQWKKDILRIFPWRYSIFISLSVIHRLPPCHSSRTFANHHNLQEIQRCRVTITSRVFSIYVFFSRRKSRSGLRRSAAAQRTGAARWRRAWCAPTRRSGTRAPATQAARC